MSPSPAGGHDGFPADSAMDRLPLAELRRLQLDRLQRLVRDAYAHVELYRRRLDERRVAPDSVKALVVIRRR